MFSQTAEYALRAVVHLAQVPERQQTGREIAEAMAIPFDYLAKVMRQLVLCGIVRGQRGKTGGFVLARPVRAISVLDVLNAVDPVKRIRECPLGLAQHRDQLCPLHRKLDRTLAALEEDFRSTSLAELV